MLSSSKIKVVAIDIDYTLIGSDLEISASTKSAIDSAIASGAIITLATGRMYKSAVPFAKTLNIDAPLITYDGALVKTAETKELYWHKPIPIKHSRKILKHLNTLGVHINVYVDDEVYVESLNEKTRHYSERIKVKINPVGNLLDFLDKPPTKLLMQAEPVVIDKLLPELERKFGNISHVERSLPQYIEFTDKGVTKGSALAELGRILGIEKSEIMAIGDCDNDISMISYAGIGVAVNNARECVKEAADYVTQGINGDGVAESIYRFVLKDR